MGTSEKKLEGWVKELAKLFGYRYYHTWRSLHSPAGFCDCVLVRPPRLIFAELKSDRGKLTPEQEAWLDVLSRCPGVEVYLWKPDDFQDISDILMCHTLEEVPASKTRWPLEAKDEQLETSARTPPTPGANE